jgi:thiamine-phosphate pyrophosphorylase
MRLNKNPERAYLRIIDANLNRSKEAIRVIEDITRFALHNDSLTKRLQRIRHEISKTLLNFPKDYRKLLKARDVDRDVGRGNRVRDKKSKVQLEDLWVSNLKRAQEALRVLEEFSKILAPHQSGRFQRLRFKLYGLEKRSLSEF